LKWVSKSHAKLATALQAMGHKVSPQTVRRLLQQIGYSRQGNSGWVSVGVTHDTAQFAVNAIRCWLAKMGRARYPAARRLMITADCGSSNGARLRLCKIELQKLADDTGLTLSICHYPPGTSK
jgi:hypothetical protein